MDFTVQQVVDTYKHLAMIPKVFSGTLLHGQGSDYMLESVWQQRDLERTEHVRFSKWSSLTVSGNEIQRTQQFPPSEINKEKLARYSHCGEMRAVIREVLTKESKKVQYLEIWSQLRKITNVNLNDLDKHGEVHTNDQFGSLEWSEDSKKLLYVAEKKLPKTRSYFKTPVKEDDGKPGNEHLWKESWGEQLTEAHHPILCVFDIESKEVSLFNDKLPEEISAGQAIWLHDNVSVIFVGWVHEPYRLGLRYCPIRRNRLYMLNTKLGICSLISTEDCAVSCPRLHPTNDVVFFLQNPVGGPHMHCQKLMSVDLSTPKSGCKVVVDTVRFAKSENDFPGIYSPCLPEKCWMSNGKYFLMPTAWRSHSSIVAVNAENGDVKRLTKEGDWNILDIKDGIIVASFSSPSVPPQILVAKFDAEAPLVVWTPIEKPSDSFNNIKWSVHAYKPEVENPEFPHLDCEYILHQPMGDAIDPTNKSLVVFPHGGPHSCCVTGFYYGNAGLCQLGFTVVQVNYRGSTGFGQDSIDSTPGRVGTQDVQDVQQVAKMLKDQLNCDRVFVTGGSHGGFLSLHLISQYPDFYLAACVRNPVANISVMSGTSDIPDWTYCEAGFSDFTLKTLPATPYYSAMLEKSPIFHIQNAKAPLLMMLGEIDLRCPVQQAFQWAKAYKALGKKCKVLEYKDNNHPLAKVDAEADGFVNLVMWFKEHEDFSK